MARPYPQMTKDNTALLVIDVINSCAHETCEIPQWKIHFSKIRAMVPALKTFITNFREQTGAKVIFAKTTPWREEFLPKNINLLYTDPHATYYSKDTSGFPEEFYMVTPKTEDKIIEKNNYSCFSSPAFDEYLQKNGIQFLVITGIFTDGCVLATVTDGFAKGYNFVVLNDLIETTDSGVRQELHHLLIDYTFPVMYGKTIPSVEFLENW